MKAKSKMPRLLSALIVISILSVITISQVQPATGQTTRTGGWLDAITINVGSGDPIDDVQSDIFDIYSQSLPANQYELVEDDPTIKVSTSSGLYYELTLNPAVFYDDTKLNPFADQQIREAMNWLIDRSHLNDITYDGLALEKFFPIVTYFPDYERYLTKVTQLETDYAYNLSKAEGLINARMLALGANNVGDGWYFEGEPVKIILLIRNDSDGLRVPMGDYVADQLEAIGFHTERQYLTSSEATPLWVGGDPADGQWHIYTGAWSATVIDRDEGDNFQFFLSPNSAYGFSGLWQAYEPTPEFEDIMEKLAYNTFSTLDDRDILFERALEYSMQFAVRIWLLDGRSISIRRADTTIANDLGAGIGGNMWPYTARFTDLEGGHMRIGASDLLLDSWNPISGSNWAYDQFPARATLDYGLVFNPHDGLALPQRVRSAVVTAETGLPITKTEDWVTLEFTDKIVVPDDAWADWDAAAKKFITEGDLHATDTHAKVRSVVVYPIDLFSKVKWHDGSPLSPADFVMNMILPFDRTKPASPIYDPGAFRDESILGIRITSLNPLTIETYRTGFQLDAELNVVDWWPNGGYGPSPWHTTALAARAEAAHLLAFSADKAGTLGVPWTNYIDGPSLSILRTQLDACISTHHIPYATTLSSYISTADADLRWQNLRKWYTNYGHFWVGSGPYFLEDVNWLGKSLVLRRFAEFPDLSDRWDIFQEGEITTLLIDHPDGAPGSTFIIYGYGYLPNQTADIYINWVKVGSVGTGPDGGFTFTLEMPDSAGTGVYLVSVRIPLLTRDTVMSRTLSLILDEEAPLRETEPLDTHIESTVTDPVKQIFMPVIMR